MTTERTPAPLASRPRIPRDYGVPRSTKGLLDWEHVAQRLADATVYWIATSGPGGMPRARPVDGLYVDDVLYVGGSPETGWVRDLTANPKVCVHLDDGWDVVILEGEVARLEGADPELARRLAAESNRKYPQYGMTEKDSAGPGTLAIRPARAYAWKAFPKDVTKFTFPAGDRGRG
jgi:nitroimidazol reductase NimA-like FMN-containing flavoprotein (pyridoxamine 5'-phosphate oxidase superfamily)